jgi:signal transduction histidine kinase
MPPHSRRRLLHWPPPAWLAALTLGSVSLLPIHGSERALPAPLTSAATVRALSAAAAAEARPVRLEGVVLTVTDWPALVLWDETDGIYITVPPAQMAQLQPGAWVITEGVTGAGNFAPIVKGAMVRRLGTRPLPTPLRTTVTEVAGGGFDAKWVEVEGIVRSCVNARIGPAGFEDTLSPTANAAPGRESSFLTVASGDVLLRVRLSSALDPATVVDARVRLRGVCFNVHNANRQFVRANLRVPRAEDLRVLDPPPADPFALPLRRAASLLQFDPSGFTGHRVLVRGVVTRRQAGNVLWIRDGDRGLRIVSGDAARVAPGDEIDVAGFIERGKYAPALVDALLRRRAGVETPEPITIERIEEAVAHEANLVRIQAELREVRTGPDVALLTLDWAGTTLEAMLPKLGADQVPTPWEPGSRLQLTGICSVAPGATVPENGLWTAERFQLLLHEPADVVVLRAAPWLNPRRVTMLLGSGALALVAGLVFLWSHSRRQIAQRENERKMAEAEFAAILGERNRVARDIHDTLAQGLNAVSMQLELAKNVAGRGSDAVLPHVATAHTIVRSCLAEARESIWNMRSHALEKSDLAGALGSVLRQMSEGLPIETRIDVTGESRRLAPQLENDLLRIGQEGIANALKHAAASRLALRLEFEPGKVRLRITDNGRGFDPAVSQRATSRFGIKGIHERVQQMGATLHLTSAPGGGTELLVEVAPPGDRGSRLDAA